MKYYNDELAKRYRLAEDIQEMRWQREDAKGAESEMKELERQAAIRERNSIFILSML